MSKNARLARPVAAAPETSLFAQVEQELANGFVQVEHDGISLRRLVCVYLVLTRNAAREVIDSLRSRLGPTPVH